MMSNGKVVSGLALWMATSLTLCALMCLSPLASAELSEDWQVEDPMRTNRTQAVVLQDNDGIVYFMGGVRNMPGGGYGPEVGNVESFNPSTGEWLDLASMPYGVRGAAGALGGDGRIYVFGGVNDSASTYTTTQIYDPATDVWTTGADVPLGVWEAKAASSTADEILVVGGEGAYASTQIYNIADDSWSAGGSLPSDVMAGALLNIGYYSYYIGGSEPGYAAVDTVYRYESWSDSWSIVDPMPVPTAAHAAVVGADNLVYVIGGADNAFNVGLGYNTSYCFNPDSGEWTQLKDIPDGVRYLGAAASADGVIYAFGGNNDTVVLPQVLSLRVMELSSSLSPSEVHAGDSVVVTMSVEFANKGAVTGSDYHAYFLTSEGIPINPVYGWIDGPYSTIAIELEVPVTAEPGILGIVVQWYVGTVTGDVELPQQELQLTVVDAPTLGERVAALEIQVAALEAQLVDVLAQLDAMSSDINATEAILLDGIAMLEDEVSALQSQLDALESAMAAADDDMMDEMELLQDHIGSLEDQMASLESNLSALLNSLDETRESVDDVQASVDSKAENSMLYGVVGLLVVVIVLLIVMMVMGRKPKASPMPPEPPVE
jgi:N-acetylneuraminic acid mutarotase/chaperonin cofactor prefoldin